MSAGLAVPVGGHSCPIWPGDSVRVPEAPRPRVPFSFDHSPSYLPGSIGFLRFAETLIIRANGSHTELGISSSSTFDRWKTAIQLLGVEVFASNGKPRRSYLAIRCGCGTKIGLEVLGVDTFQSFGDMFLLFNPRIGVRSA